MCRVAFIIFHELRLIFGQNPNQSIDSLCTLVSMNLSYWTLVWHYVNLTHHLHNYNRVWVFSLTCNSSVAHTSSPFSLGAFIFFICKSFTVDKTTSRKRLLHSTCRFMAQRGDISSLQVDNDVLPHWNILHNYTFSNSFIHIWHSRL